MNETVLAVKDLTKRFGSFTAVNDIDFQLSAAQFWANLGQTQRADREE